MIQAAQLEMQPWQVPPERMRGCWQDKQFEAPAPLQDRQAGSQAAQAGVAELK